MLIILTLFIFESLISIYSNSPKFLSNQWNASLELSCPDTLFQQVVLRGGDLKQVSMGGRDVEESGFICSMFSRNKSKVTIFKVIDGWC